MHDLKKELEGYNTGDSDEINKKKALDALKRMDSWNLFRDTKVVSFVNLFIENTFWNKHILILSCSMKNTVNVLVFRWQSWIFWYQEHHSYTVAHDSFLAQLGSMLWGSMRHVIAPSASHRAYHYYEKLSFQLYFVTQEVYMLLLIFCILCKPMSLYCLCSFCFIFFSTESQEYKAVTC